MLAKASAPSDRRQDIIHPSEMAKADWCPRQTWYRLSGQEPTDKVKAHGHQLENIFDEGHAIHDKWQRRIWETGRLWGKWRCLICGNEWYGTSPEVCENGLCNAGKPVLQYREVPLDGEDKWLIVGHEDGAVLDLNALVEIKSIGQGSLRMEEPALLQEYLVETVDGKRVYDLDGIWKNLKRPLSSHIRQTSIYCAIAQHMGMDIDKVIFLYEYKSNQSVKEMTIRYNPRIAEPLLDSALDIKYALSSGTQVARPAERTREHKGCKECPFLTQCWGTDAAQSDEDEPCLCATGFTCLASEHVGSNRSGGSRSGADVVAGHRPTRASRRSSPRAAGGPDRDQRLDPDEPVPGTDGMAGVHGVTTGRSRSGRTVIRKRTADPGSPVSSA